MQSPYRKAPTILPDEQKDAELQGVLDYFTRPKIDPSKSDTFQFTDRLLQVTDKIARFSVNYDRDHNTSLNPFVSLAVNSTFCYTLPKKPNESTRLSTNSLFRK